MIDHQEFTASTLAGALQQAADRFHSRPENLKYEILSEKRGFLGVGSREVAVRVEVPTAAPTARPTVRGERGMRRGAPPTPPPASHAVVGQGSSEGEQEEFPEPPSGPDPTAPRVGELATEVVRAAGLELTISLVEHEDRITIELAGPDRDLLLDRRGDTLNALQYLMNRMARKSLGTTKRVQLESEGFRSDRDEELRAMALEVAERVLQSGREELLPPLNPYERRIVHMAVSGRPGLTSESEGDGFIKRVTVRPANAGRTRVPGGFRRREPRH